jgi:hypothetical protein
MGQNKFYINYGFTRILIGVDYEKGFSFQIHLLFITFGIGLTQGAKGFGVWKNY